MHIGVTCDLESHYTGLGLDPEDVAEFDQEETVEAVQQALQHEGHSVDLIGNLPLLLPRLVAGHRWDLVFNFAEGRFGPGRESQIPALLDAFQIPYTFSDPVTLGVCLHKGLAKRVVSTAGVRTPPFLEVDCLDALAECDIPYPLFAKPVAEGTSKGIEACSRIDSPTTLRSRCEYLLERFRQPVLVEQFISGPEVTVGILGSGRRATVLGVMEVSVGDRSQGAIYSHFVKKNFEGRVSYRLVDGEAAAAASQAALKAWSVLGCRDAGRVDIMFDEAGVPNFIECNPLAGINPQVSDLCIVCKFRGISYQELIRGILKSASERL